MRQKIPTYLGVPLLSGEVSRDRAVALPKLLLMRDQQPQPNDNVIHRSDEKESGTGDDNRGESKRERERRRVLQAGGGGKRQ